MEGFFYISCQVDETRLTDLILRRYHQLDFIKEMRLDEFLELISLAVEEEQKEKHRQEWLHLLPLILYYLTRTDQLNKLYHKIKMNIYKS